MKSSLAIAISLAAACFAQAEIITTFDIPGAIQTKVWDIDGDVLVGDYQSADGVVHGFRSDGRSIVTLDFPGARDITAVTGVSGSDLVGYYAIPQAGNAGFLNDTAFEFPGARSTEARSIQGATIVGFYQEGDSRQGFILDDTGFFSLRFPGAQETLAMDIDGDRIVGIHQPTSPPGFRGFMFDGLAFTTLEVPGANMTMARGISGDLIAGGFDEVAGPTRTRHGFLFDGTSYSVFDVPDAIETDILGIDGSRIVGYYSDVNRVRHGFIANLHVVPEPSGFLVWLFLAVVVICVYWFRARKLHHGVNK